MVRLPHSAQPRKDRQFPDLPASRKEIAVCLAKHVSFRYSSIMNIHFRKLSLISLLGFILASSFSLAKEPSILDQMLTDRIKLNEKYRDEYAKVAEDSPLAKDLVPLEKKVGQAWVDYLTYIQSLKNPKLTKATVKLEILSEIQGCYYDLEYAEGFIEKASIRSDLAKWKKKLAKLEKVAVKGDVPQPIIPITPEAGPIKK